MKHFKLSLKLMKNQKRSLFSVAPSLLHLFAISLALVNLLTN